MKKNRYLTIMLLLLTAAAPNIHAQEMISEILVRGNRNVSARQIRNRISLSEGEEFSAAATGTDIVSILDMDSFEDVTVSIEDAKDGGIRLIYTVEEKPLVSAIEFKGNNEIRTRTLRRNIELEAGGFFDSFVMRNGLRALERYYRDEGYADVRAEAYTEVSEDTGVKVIYYIEEGVRQEIEKITLLGVLQVRPRRVNRLLQLKQGDVFSQIKLDESIEKIRTYYRNNGYVKVSIDAPSIVFTSDRSGIYILINLREGERYHIGSISFEGNTEISSESLINALAGIEGSVYSDEKIESVIALVHEKYGERGHIRMSAEPVFDYDDDENTVNMNVRITEGPRVYIRNIFLDGNNITKDYVITRELYIEEGEPFNLRKVRESQSRIFRTGFFSNVRIDMLPAGAPDRTDLVFLLDEQKTGMASLGAGYSSEDSLVGTVRISQENFLGRGQQLSAMWEFGSRRQNYRIDFYEPWLRNTPTPFRTSIYSTMRQRYYGWDNISASYKETRSGGSISLGRHFTREFTGQVRYSLENVRQHDVSSSIQDRVPESRNTTSSVTPSLTYDTRDFPFDPSTGYILRLSNQIAGGIFGGDQDFIKLDGRATYFQPLIWKFVGVLNLNFGSIFTYGQTDRAPIYERFTVGGSESVRGYEYYGDIGPSGGGHHKLVGNLELKFPIVREGNQTIIQGAFFYDIGGAWSDGRDITLNAGLGKNELKRGYGFGIRFKMPGFPIRLDWGYGIDRRPKEAQWYFTLGDIFY